MSQGRNRVLLPGHYIVHGHCGQHLQPDFRTRRLYPLYCFTERLVGLSVTQSITEKRRWHLSFTSFYPVIHGWLRTRTVRWNSPKAPVKPLQPNFETGSYIRSYVNLFYATGKQAQDEGTELSRDDFCQGCTFFGFDLTPDGCEGGCFHLTRKGNLRIEMHFATALEHTVNVVVYGEFRAVLEIDKGRNIIYNY